MALIDKLTNIADAIRSKTGKEDKFTLEQMADEINNLSIGDSETEDGLVTRTITEYHNNRVTQVGMYGFAENRNLESVDLPNVVRLGSYAFYNCTALKEVAFPHIARDARCGNRIFLGCTGLIKVDFPALTRLSSNQGYWFSGCTELKDVNVPLLKEISLRTFQSCTSLEKLILPSVLFFSSYVFEKCSALNTLVLKSNTVATLGAINSFTGTPIEAGTGYIYVPRALIEQYKVATNWITYAEQFRAIEDYPEICGGAEE